MRASAISLSILLFLFFILSPAHAEDKPGFSFPPKLSDAETRGGPQLTDGTVYPFWGMPCTNFTYRVIYKDAQGRPPSYVRIWLDGNWHDMTKQSGDYNGGALYSFNYIPDSGEEIFYFFEAGNGVGKARSAFIDSPNQGPILYSEPFDNNQVILLRKNGGLAWAFDTGADVVYDVSLSDDGEYVAAGTERYVYLFSKNSSTPLWKFCRQCSPPKISLGQNTAAAVSGDGQYVVASLDGRLYYFSRENKTPLWSADITCNAVGVAVSEHGDYVSAGVSNCGEKGNSVFFFSKDGALLWKYKTNTSGYANSGEMYGPAMTPDGGRVAVSSGCPDRRAYLFARDGQMLYRSEPLQRDAPVHKSAISNDGKFIAYGSDGEAGKPNKFLFSSDGRLVWSHTAVDETDARAISISGDGNYVASGTSSGRIYLFSRTGGGRPLWIFAEKGDFAKVGDVKLNQDGSLLAAGTSTSKVYLFSRGSSTPLWEYRAPTWINSVDFNGEYIVAGTGFKEYQFEGNSAPPQHAACARIIQPPEPENDIGGGGVTAGGAGATCGNTICEPDGGESAQTCRQDCGVGEDGFTDGGKAGSGRLVCSNGRCDMIELDGTGGQDMMERAGEIISWLGLALPWSG